MEFNLDYFIKYNTFFNQNEETPIDKIINESHDKFGEEIVMYYFYHKDYTISFVYDREEKKIIGQQAEFSNYQKYGYDKFIKLFKEEIDSIYFEDDDFVVLLNSGVDAFFHNKHIRKLTSKNIETRKLIYKTMLKITNTKY